MSIYDYQTNNCEKFLLTSATPELSSRQQNIRLCKAKELIGKGAYQSALDLLADCHDDEALHVKAVLLLRLGQPNSAADLLRNKVWDLRTFTIKPNVASHVQLNFATALFMTGHVSGCIDVIKANNGPVNEQALELTNEIQGWEKSLSLFRWSDWKICGIEHVKDGIPFRGTPGRFGWESSDGSNGLLTATDSRLPFPCASSAS